MTIFAALAFNLTISGYLVAARQPPPLAQRVFCCVVRTLEMCAIAAEGRPFAWDAISAKPHLTAVGGLFRTYLRCDGTPLVLVYGRGANATNDGSADGGPFLRVAPLGFARSTVTHQGVFDRLQGCWLARGFAVCWLGGPLIRPIEAGVTIRGNTMTYGGNLFAFHFLITASRSAGFDTVGVAYPDPLDHVLMTLAYWGTPMTARRFVAPLGPGLLTVADGGRGWIEASYWTRTPGR